MDNGLKLSPYCLEGECSGVQLPEGRNSCRPEEEDCTAGDQHAFEDGELEAPDVEV